MMISSRTPEGVPHRCPVCGGEAAVDPSFPGGDSTCPRCGHLLWWFRDRLAQSSRSTADPIHPGSTLRDDLGIDSLDVVELVMEIEEAFDLQIPDEEAERLRTIGDVIRYIIECRGSAAAGRTGGRGGR